MDIGTMDCSGEEVNSSAGLLLGLTVSLSVALPVSASVSDSRFVFSHICGFWRFDSGDLCGLTAPVNWIQVLIASHGGAIKVNSLDGNADLESQGGTIEVCASNATDQPTNCQTAQLTGCAAGGRIWGIILTRSPSPSPLRFTSTAGWSG